ncbi:MAG: hypothetical protein HQM09_18680 [Candidatus Riflebacteria bacterium]|nr:hypothetical protein [Candidatus Riflebacteria bacterium]
MLEFLTLRLRNVPVNPETVFEPFRDEVVGLLGGDLLSLAVYGSAASGDYVYGPSNINMVFIMKTITVAHLKVLALPMERWMVRGFAAPRIFSLVDLERSLDVFPLLFMDIRDNHRMLFGTDPFGALQIDRSLLRIQVEQMLKGLVTETRTEFLASGESLSNFESMITRTFGSVFPLLRALLFLKGKMPSVRKEVVVAMAEEEFSLDSGVMTDALRHKLGVIRLSQKHHLLAYFERFLAAIEKLADIADRIE